MARVPGLYRRGNVWWCKYYVNGRPVRESTKTEKETAAKRILDDRRGRVATGQPILPRADRVRYDELAADLMEFYRTTGRWKNLDGVEDRLGRLATFFKGHRAMAITPDLITRYVAKRQQETTHLIAERDTAGVPIRWGLTSNATINRELALLRRMLRLAARRRKILSVPAIDLLDEAPARAGFFEDHQYRAVVKRLPEDLQAALAIAHTYGWRMRSEVLPLERRQLDLKTATLRLEPGTTKNGDGRLVYLIPDVKALLEAQLARVEALQKRLGRIVPYLFPHMTGKRRRGEPRRGFTKAWRAACDAAGVPGRIPHDFRRTAVRNLERAGVPRSVAMKITGHKTEAVYRRYAIVSDADLQEAARKLAGTFTGTIRAMEVAPTS
jgi:integrase